MADAYGDFEEVVEDGVKQPTVDGEIPVRVRLPREGELIGVVVQRFGGKRMEVRATDGKSRNCRVPGRYQRSLWLRPKDIVLITPWKDDPTKGDVIFKYHSSMLNQLRKRGLLQNLQIDF